VCVKGRNNEEERT